MRLQKELVLPQARIKKLKIVLSTEEHKVTLTIRAALTQEVAESFGCRELIYAGNVPRSGVEKMSLEGKEVDCDVKLNHEGGPFATVVEEMGKYVAYMEGDGPKLEFEIKFTGFVITIAELIERVKTDPLEIILKPAQLDLGLQNKEEREDGPCTSCNNDIPMSAPDLHVNGQPCVANQAPMETAVLQDESNEGTLPMASLVGGTHQRGTKKARGRRKPDDSILEGETEDIPIHTATDDEESVFDDLVN